LNLAEFVEETLSEILEGIRAAQKKEGGGAIGAGRVVAWSPTYHISPLLAQGSGDDVFTVVEFDVSVLAETSGSGKGELKVWSVGSIEAGASAPTSTRAGCGLPFRSKFLPATRWSVRT
jgi:hypothetical protein